jgi:hypothetical protein
MLITCGIHQSDLSVVAGLDGPAKEASCRAA